MRKYKFWKNIIRYGFNVVLEGIEERVCKFEGRLKDISKLRSIEYFLVVLKIYKILWRDLSYS